MTKDEMAEWHHILNIYESEQTPGDGEGQGSLVYCSSWGCKESDMTYNKVDFCIWYSLQVKFFFI